jgi:hypothetical protein
VPCGELFSVHISGGGCDKDRNGRGEKPCLGISVTDPLTCLLDHQTNIFAWILF